MASGFAGPLPLREETFIRADGSTALNLHFCNVNKQEAAASNTEHIVFIAKADSYSPNPAGECQAQFKTGFTHGSTYGFRLASNSPEENLVQTDLPAPDDDNMWTVGAFNYSVADKFCGWSQIPPRVFTSPF